MPRQCLGKAIEIMVIGRWRMHSRCSAVFVHVQIMFYMVDMASSMELGSHKIVFDKRVYVLSLFQTNGVA